MPTETAVCLSACPDEFAGVQRSGQPIFRDGIFGQSFWLYLFYMPQRSADSSGKPVNTKTGEALEGFQLQRVATYATQPS